MHFAYCLSERLQLLELRDAEFAVGARVNQTIRFRIASDLMQRISLRSEIATLLQGLWTARTLRLMNCLSLNDDGT